MLSTLQTSALRRVCHISSSLSFRVELTRVVSRSVPSSASLFEEEQEEEFEKFYPMTLGKSSTRSIRPLQNLASDPRARYGAVVTWCE
jgi:hypothetical protein